MIDASKLNHTTFCILTLWIAGFSTDTIARFLEVTSGRVRGVVRSKESGGKMPISREEMTLEQRQAALDVLKANRKDGGFLEPFCFTARELNPSQATKQGRRDAGQYRKETGMLLDAARKRREKRESGLNERRGDRANPILYLSMAEYGDGDTAKLLDDPKAIREQSEERVSAVMRRVEAAKWFQSLAEASQISGFGEVSLEVSSGGIGMPITERVVVALNDLRSIQAMMSAELYNQVLVPVVAYDAFIWEVPSRIAKEKSLEEIRLCLDAVCLYQGTLSRGHFRARWGEPPMIPKRRERSEVRDAVQTARELIREGARQ